MNKRIAADHDKSQMEKERWSVPESNGELKKLSKEGTD